jgi:hypothetical protein
VNRYRLSGLLLALVSSLVLSTPNTGAAAPTLRSPAQIDALVAAIEKYRAAAWHWQRVRGKPHTKSNFVERHLSNPVRLAAIREVWKRRAARQRLRVLRAPHRAAWRCIHRHEASWDDPNAPYYGGLQMSLPFQRAHGRYLLRLKGTADKWKPVEQMWTAERAFRAGLGFSPWPNTARECGLL